MKISTRVLLVFLIAVNASLLYATGCGSGSVGLTDAMVPESTGEGGEGGRVDGGVAGGDEEPAAGATSFMSILSTDPGDGSRGIILNKSVTIQFDQPLDPATVNGSTLYVMPAVASPEVSLPLIKATLPQAGESVAGTVGCIDDPCTEVAFTPSQQFAACHTFQIIVTTDVHSLADDLSAEGNQVFTFKAACPLMMSRDEGSGNDAAYSVQTLPNGMVLVGGGVTQIEGLESYYRPWMGMIDSDTMAAWEWSSVRPGMKDRGVVVPESTAIVYHGDDLFTVGYEEDGIAAQGWFQRIDQSGTGLWNGAIGLSIAASAETDVVCRNMAFNNDESNPRFALLCFDYAEAATDTAFISYVLIYDADGVLQAYGEFDAADKSTDWGDATFSAGAFDDDGSLYATMGSIDRLTGNSAMRIVKFTPAQLADRADPMDPGEWITTPVQVAQFLDAPVSSEGNDIAIAQENGQKVFYVAGYANFGIRSRDIDALVVKFNEDGETLWFHNPGGGGKDYLNAVSLEKGSIYLAGTLGRDMGGGISERRDMIFIKYDSAGNAIYQKVYAGLAGSDEDYAGLDILADPYTDEVYIVGNSNPTGAASDIAIWRVDDDGETGNIFPLANYE
jgi:hypothetical protein